MRHVWKKKLSIFCIAALLLLCSAQNLLAAGSQYTNVGNPVLDPTRTHGITTHDQPIQGPQYGPPGEYGNLVVTGRISQGKHFRGVVPYNSTSDLGVTLGSDDIEDFLRRSAPPAASRSPGTATPYYLSSRTVTSMRRGQGSGLEYPRITADGRSDGFIPPIQSVEPVQIVSPPLAYYTKFRPIERTPKQLSDLIDRQLRQNQLQPDQTQDQQDQQYQADMDKLQKGLTEVEQRAEKLKDRLFDESLTPPEPWKPQDETVKPLQPPGPFEKITPLEQIDVYEQMLRLTGQEPNDRRPAEVEQPPVEQPAGEKAAEKPAQPMPSYGLESRTGQALMGLYKSFAGPKKNKFNEYMALAEKYMKMGKYYKAADTYTLAAIYEPDNPLSYAGKAYALLAAGEYMSSAFFLSKAIKIFPQYALVKVDIVEMIGDRDKLESRIVDLLEWRDATLAPELEFLLAYIYYQTGNLPKAAELIESAYEQMRDAPAVDTLRKVISDSRLKE
ncbi:MAG: tetratricopeptide repeat protein [Planctomycetota bacterium]